jgi:WD40 repeat protein
MRRPLGFFFLIASFLASAASARAQEPIAVNVPQRTGPVSFSKEVADFLDAKCVGCHSSALAENRLNMETVAGMLKGGKRGPAIVSGKADESLLFKMAAHRIEPVMPPKDKKDQKPLTPDELGLLKLWIDAGAQDDTEASEEGPRTIELGALPPGVHPIIGVDMTADGRRVAAGRANTVQVYDVDSGLEIISLGGHKDLIQALRYAPDGSKLAAGSYQIVTVWDVPTGGETKAFPGHGEAVRGVASLPGGQGFVSASTDRTLRFWDAAQGKETARIDVPDAQALAVSVSPDGKLVAAGCGDNTVRIWTLADRKERAVLKGHAGPVTAVAFLAGPGRIASASADGTARVWVVPSTPDQPAREPIVLEGHQGPVHALAASPDGQLIVTGGEDRTARLWHAVDGRAMRTLEGHEGPVLSVAFDPRGRTLATGSGDARVRLFDIDDGKMIRVLTTHLKPVQAIAFSPSGTHIATAGAEGGIKVWETDTGQGTIAFGHRGVPDQPLQPLHALAFLADGQVVSGSADKTLKTWSFQGSWTLKNTLGPHVFRVLALDFHTDGNLIAVGGGEPSRSGEVKVWEIPRGLLIYDLKELHSDTVFGVKFSPDGRFLASAAADKFLKVVKMSHTRQVRTFEGHTHHVMGVDWRADGQQLVSAGADNVLKIWEADTGEQVRTTQPAGKQVTAVRWLPGKPTIAGASGDKLVRFWDANNGGVQRNFGGPEDYVFCLAVSADGSRVAAGGADGVLFIWRGDNAQLLNQLAPPASGAPAPTALAR